jgi:hypothetical protein
VLVDLGAVVDRHVPAAEVHHPGAGGAMCRIERGLLEHGFLQTKQKKHGVDVGVVLSVLGT